MAEKIEPALTAEEWVEFLADIGDHNGDHSWAAECLYGQPFGFTRTDLGALQAAAQHFDECGAIRWASAPMEAETLHSLIDRIAALLPPREDTPSVVSKQISRLFLGPK